MMMCDRSNTPSWVVPWGGSNTQPNQMLQNEVLLQCHSKDATLHALPPTRSAPAQSSPEPLHPLTRLSRPRRGFHRHHAIGNFGKCTSPPCMLVPIVNPPTGFWDRSRVRLLLSRGSSMTCHWRPQLLKPRVLLLLLCPASRTEPVGVQLAVVVNVVVL
jgi:hypothetical protein